MTRLELVERLAAAWSAKLKTDLSAYKNHVYRVFYLCCELESWSADEKDGLLVLLFFHDLGIWSANTLDYLEPSVRLAIEHLEGAGMTASCEPAALAIREHHKLRAFRGEHSRWVETVRRADLIDLSFGLVRFGVDARAIRKIRASFPNHGFHRFLLFRFLRHWARHPFNLFPMVRW